MYETLLSICANQREEEYIDPTFFDAFRFGLVIMKKRGVASNGLIIAAENQAEQD